MVVNELTHNNSPPWFNNKTLTKNSGYKNRIQSPFSWIKFKQWKNLLLGRAFVIISERLRSVEIFLTITDPWPITSLIKFSLISMCFVLSWCTKFLDKSMALWLSQCIVITSLCIFNSFAMPSSHKDSFTSFVRAIYSVYVVDKATTFWRLAFQLITVPKAVNTNPVRDFLESKQPT